MLCSPLRLSLGAGQRSQYRWHGHSPSGVRGDPAGEEAWGSPPHASSWAEEGSRALSVSREPVKMFQ